MYHRVFAPAADPQLLCVAPERFEQHMRLLRAEYPVLSLHDFARHRHAGALPKRAVVITFDDGYADNLAQALPTLDRHGLPATVFVTTGLVGESREFWWDELERLLLVPRALPDRLQVCIRDREYAWALGASADNRPAAWDVTWPVDPAPRYTAYRELCALMRPLLHDERETVLRAARTQLHVDEHGRSEYRALTWDEVRRLTKSGVVEVGAHSVTHPVLAAMPAAAQTQEMADSKRALEAALGQPVTSFAYPFGGVADFDATTRGIARAIGFEVACSTLRAPATRRSDLLALPRLTVRDWPPAELVARLDALFRS